jgi:hypothetical protein
VLAAAGQLRFRSGTVLRRTDGRIGAPRQAPAADTPASHPRIARLRVRPQW